MNAAQRRKAYRKIDRMAGKTFAHIKNSGEKVLVSVLGRTGPVHLMASNSDDSTFEGVRPSVHRARCQRHTSSASIFSLRLSTLRPA